MQLIAIVRTNPMAVPADGVEDTQAVPLDVKTLPSAPADVNPVPPFAIGKVPVTPVAKLTFVIVLFEPFMVLFVNVSVPDAVTTLVGVMMPDSVVIGYSVGCVGQVISQGKPA